MPQIIASVRITVDINLLLSKKRSILFVVAFKIYDINQDGYISNGELFTVLKMMVGNNLKEVQLQQIVDKTIIQFDTDGDGKISYEEFCNVSLRNLNFVDCVTVKTNVVIFTRIMCNFERFFESQYKIII